MGCLWFGFVRLLPFSRVIVSRMNTGGEVLLRWLPFFEGAATPSLLGRCCCIANRSAALLSPMVQEAPASRTPLTLSAQRTLAGAEADADACPVPLRNYRGERRSSGAPTGPEGAGRLDDAMGFFSQGSGERPNAAFALRAWLYELRDLLTDALPNPAPLTLLAGSNGSVGCEGCGS
ncbi:hypothetical protein BDZ90DRAFT_52373 [Jaminaea rosea]|uniref:Uncharacterized protein n=1 Tax=Jaminaea rosea TaxID=1569628 RepID=A0A316UM84_9BASI|nr:hypothetical protein BDZ90DRAFT_52373 [Jaminaea rosea]PWN26330.1 hypothetical protein BDZ90DRAFT_52373 [Jaminaea rosea]